MTWLETFARDMRSAGVSLRRRRGFTVTVVLVLGLGVGANTALFSVVDAVLLRPLPYPHADRLVGLGTVNDPQGLQQGVSSSDFADWMTRAQAFETAGLYLEKDMNLAGEGEPERVTAGLVSAGLLEMFGAQPIVGRQIVPVDQQARHDAVVLLSEHVWNRRYGRSREVVGRTLVLDGQPVEIAGVMPELATFRGVDLWRPLPAESAASPRDQRQLIAFARLRSGVALEQAAAELDGIGRILAQVYPATDRDWRPTVRLLHDQFSDGPRLALLSLAGTGSFLLLIACANVASLLLAHGAERRHELAVRRALGAGLRRLVRLLATETLLLAVLGGGAALLLSWWAIDGLAAAFGQLWNPIEMNRRVMAFAFLVSIGSMALCGLAPAWLAARDATPQLVHAGRDGGSPRARLRIVFTAAQFALAAVLLAGAGFMLVSLQRAVVQDRGFDPSGVLTFQVSLPTATYASNAQVTGLFDRLISQVAGVPGVASAGITSEVPIIAEPRLQRYADGEAAGDARAADGRAAVRVTGPGYFTAIALPLRAGRDFDAGDTAASEPVVVVNESFARGLWPGLPTLGRRVRLLDDEDVSRVVVGIVADARQDVGDEIRAECYVPFAQAPRRTMTVAARVRPDAGTGFEDISRAVATVDPDLPMYRLSNLEDVLAAGSAERGLAAAIVAVFGAVAIGLAAVGLGGLLLSLVAARTREIGLRLALGAHTRDIVELVLGEFMRAAVVALAVGLAAAMGLAQVFRHAFYGVSPADVTMFAGVALLEIAVVILVGLGSVRRALRIDMVAALRAE